MPLCEACAALAEGQERTVSGHLHHHHRTLRDLVKATEDGCPVCVELWMKMRETATLEEHEAAWSEYNKDHAEAPLTASTYLPFAFNLEYTYRGLYVNTSFQLKPRDVSYSNARSIIGRDLGSGICSSGDLQPLSLAARWVSDCANHTRCGLSERGTWSPKRLICLGENDSTLVRLTLRGDDDTPKSYCTLSHCWGSGRVLKLTHANLEVLKTGIEIQTLPKTFRDAIHVCKILAVDYLWIDSLCILQGDSSDWSEQSLEMSLIYGHGKCNIAADASSSPGQGLFRDRPHTPVRHFHYVPHNKEAQLGPGSYDVINLELFADRVEKAPLNKRGWVLQERLLSRGVLHFTKDQILWECESTSASEAYLEGYPLQGLAKDGLLPSFSTDNGAENYRLLAWDQIVSAFTSATLSYPDDRPLAILGLATAIEKLSGDHYVLGMWKKDLVVQLCWSLREPETQPGSPRRAFPSFSWLGLDGQVDIPRESSLQHWCTIIDVFVGKLEVSNDGIRQLGRITMSVVLIPLESCEPMGIHGNLDRVVDVCRSPAPNIFVAPLRKGTQLDCLILTADSGFGDKYFRRIGKCCLAWKREVLLPKPHGSKYHKD